MNSEKGKENQQKYRNENRLKRAEYDKERYEKNKVEINRKQREYRAKKKLEKLAKIQKQ